MAPLITALLSKGLSLIANAVLAKGKDYIEEKSGIDLSKATLSDQDVMALKKFEMEHEEELMKLQLEDDRIDLEMTKALLADTDSARAREVKMAESQNASWLNKNVGPMLAILAMFVAFGLFYKVTFSDLLTTQIPNRDILLYILGVMSAVVTQIFSYYFGSSAGSKSKSDDMSRLLEAVKTGGGK
jgi:hypothetical protein